MDEKNPYIIFDNDDIETVDQEIALRKELIRIVEKDIDDLKGSRSGLTPWAIYAAMAGIIALFFGKGSDFIGLSVPTVVWIFLFLTFLIQFFQISVGFVDVSAILPREKRLFTFREKYGGLIMFFTFRFLYCILLGFFIYRYWPDGVAKYVALLPLLLLAASHGAQIYGFIKDVLLGNNPDTRRVTVIQLIISLACHVTLLIIASFFLSWPLDSATANAYAVGALCAIFVFFFELLLSLNFHFPIVTDLGKLRDDIVFRRIDDLNTALLEYRRIREGSRLFERVRDDYEQLWRVIETRDLHLDNFPPIVSEMKRLVPLSTDEPEAREHKLEQMLVFSTSLNLAFQKEADLTNDLIAENQKFIEKLHDLEAKSGDSEARELFGSIFVNKEQAYQQRRSAIQDELTALQTALGEAHSLVENSSEESS